MRTNVRTLVTHYTDRKLIGATSIVAADWLRHDLLAASWEQSLKSIFLVLTLFAAYLSPVHAQQTMNEPAASIGPAARDPDARRVNGWLKSFSTGAMNAGDAFEAPDYQGSLIEQAVRTDLASKLEAIGYRQADGDADGLLTFSIRVDEPGPSVKKLPRSPVRLEGIDNDPTDNINDPEVRPYIELGSPKKPRETVPEITVTIYARRGAERVWSGYAAAALYGGGREEIARSLVAALLDHLGRSADIEDAEFPLPADGLRTPTKEK